MTKLYSYEEAPEYLKVATDYVLYTPEWIAEAEEKSYVQFIDWWLTSGENRAFEELKHPALSNRKVYVGYVAK